MKKNTLITSIALACLTTTVAYADFPLVTIDSEIILNYDQEIDVKGAVSVPVANVSKEADISVNQFNHEAPVSAVGRVINNRPSGVDGQVISEVDVDVTAVGNNASIDVSGSSNPVIGSVQGNQVGGSTAIGEVSGNRIDLGEDQIVDVSVTAVGNNLSIDAENVKNVEGVELGSVQFNYESPTTATGRIVGNGFGVDAPGTNTAPTVTPQPRGIDPKLTVTAVGNNLSSIAPTTGSLTQINRGSPVSASGVIARNIGQVGPVELSVTAVGNNISIKQPGEEK